jgi:hypothetical protein
MATAENFEREPGRRLEFQGQQHRGREVEIAPFRGERPPHENRLKPVFFPLLAEQG